MNVLVRVSLDWLRGCEDKGCACVCEFVCGCAHCVCVRVGVNRTRPCECFVCLVLLKARGERGEGGKESTQEMDGEEKKPARGEEGRETYIGGLFQHPLQPREHGFLRHLEGKNKNAQRRGDS